MTIRLFAAFDIPFEILEQLIAIRKSIYENQNLKWETIEKLHLTLKFFGDVPTCKISDITEELKNISIIYSHIESYFTKFGLFYKYNKPAILWAGMKNSPELISLVSKINDKMTKYGFEEEKRKFKPHLTLLRLKGKENKLKIIEFNNKEIKIDKFTFNKIKLIQSKLTPHGSIYKTLDEFNLKN